MCKSNQLLSEIEAIQDKNNRELFLLFFSTILGFKTFLLLIKVKAPALFVMYSAEKIGRLEREGFKLSENDKKVILYGQILSCIRNKKDIEQIPELYNWGMHHILETQRENKVIVQKLQAEFQFDN